MKHLIYRFLYFIVLDCPSENSDNEMKKRFKKEKKSRYSRGYIKLTLLKHLIYRFIYVIVLDFPSEVIESNGDLSIYNDHDILQSLYIIYI